MRRRPKASFGFDRLDREIDSRTVPAAGGGLTRTTHTSYWPSGERRCRQKNQLGDGAAAVTDSWYSYNDGRLSRAKRHRGGTTEDDGACVSAPAAQLKDQAYSYDQNGNRDQDERGSYQFNSRDQVSRWTRGPRARSYPGSSVSYALNGSGAMTEKSDSGSGAQTAFSYDGDRLTSSETTGSDNPAENTTSSYSYDDFGAMTGSQGSGGGGGSSPPGVAPCDPSGQATPGSYGYDEFGRMTCGIGSDGRRQTFSYDGLDRRDAKTEQDAQGQSQSSDLSYIGSSEALAQETGAGSATKTYDYSSGLERQGASSGESYRAYSTDAGGSVEGLEEADGSVEPQNAMDYDPYGQLQRAPGEQQPGENLGQPAKDNPFRFEGFYADSGLQTYDMQARPYQPALGRFLTQDRFEDSAGDLTLQSDPLTQNRYAFAGGNPVNNVEWDGHHAEGALSGGYRAGSSNANYDEDDAAYLRKVAPRRKRGSSSRGRRWLGPPSSGGLDLSRTPKLKSLKESAPFYEHGAQKRQPQAEAHPRQPESSGPLDLSKERFHGDICGITSEAWCPGSDQEKKDPRYQAGKQVTTTLGFAIPGPGGGKKKLAEEGVEKASKYGDDVLDAVRGADREADEVGRGGAGAGADHGSSPGGREAGREAARGGGSVVRPVPGGNRRIQALRNIGEQGAGRNVREVPGGLDRAQEIYSGLARGAQPYRALPEGRQLLQRTDGTIIGLRSQSRSGPPSIDVRPPGERQYFQLKFTGGR